MLEGKDVRLPDLRPVHPFAHQDDPLANQQLEEWQARLGIVPFFGCAANPFSTLIHVSVNRLAPHLPLPDPGLFISWVQRGDRPMIEREKAYAAPSLWRPLIMNR